MTEHLTFKEVTDWQSGVSGAEEILRVDDHLAECADCRARVSFDAGAVRMLRVEFTTPHLTESQVDDYAERRRLSAEAMQHLDTCPECRDEAEELRKFASAAVVEMKQPIPIRRSVSVWPRSLAAAIAVMALGLAGWFALGRKSGYSGSQGSSGEAPAEIAANIPVAYQAEVNAAMDSGTLRIPASVTGLASGPVQLRSLDPSAAGKSELHAISPLATAVVEDTPVFRWTPVEGATYSVSVYDDQFRAVAVSVTLKAAEWRSEKALVRGGVYRWEVRAVKGKRVERAPSPAEPEARFIVLDAAEAQKLADARAAMPDASLAMGILYANAGALDDARRELSSVAAGSDPKRKATAEQLLGQLK